MAVKSWALLRIGKAAFIIGLVLAVLLPVKIFGAPGGNLEMAIFTAIVLLGALVGFMNITIKEAMPFLLASTVLIIVAGFGGAALGAVRPEAFGDYLRRLLGTLIAFVVPATVVVALKEIYVFMRAK